MAKKLMVIDGILAENIYQSKRKANREKKTIKLINGQLIRANNRIFCKAMIEKSKQEEKKKDLTSKDLYIKSLNEDTSKIYHHKIERIIDDNVITLVKNKNHKTQLFHKISLDSFLKKCKNS